MMFSERCRMKRPNIFNIAFIMNVGAEIYFLSENAIYWNNYRSFLLDLSAFINYFLVGIYQMAIIWEILAQRV